MTRGSALLSLLLAAPLALAACSAATDTAGNRDDAAPANTQEAAGNAEASVPSGVPAPSPSPSASPSASKVAGARVIGLEGLGDLRIGEPVPAGSGWKSRGAQAGDQCTTVTSPAYPGVYAIVENGRVGRITVGKRSDVKLMEGIGVGAREAEVEKWFAGFRSEPHKYEEAPAKYLTAPGAERGDPALRFEIGRDGRVSLIHVGTMPALGYVEGCA